MCTDGIVTDRGGVLPVLATTSVLLFLLFFGLYTWTAAPEVTFHDSGELITAAYRLGIPHPPGSPTWVMLGHMFTKLPFGSPAFRTHLMSGCFAAVTCALLYALVFHMLTQMKTSLPRWWAHVAGIVSSASLGLSPSFWEKAVQAELYTLNACFMTGMMLTFAIWLTVQPDERRRYRNLLLLLACLLGLGAGNYMAVLYFIPVFGIAVVFRNWRIIKDYKLIVLSAFVFLASFAVYMYLPLRSAFNPPLDWRNPETLSGFADVMMRKQWGSFTYSSDSGPFMREWIRSIGVVNELGLIPVGLAAIGVVYAGLRQRMLTITILASVALYAGSMMLMQATTPVLTKSLWYVIHYGMGEFHIPIYLVLALFAGLGFHWCWEALSRKGLFRMGGGVALRILASFLVLGMLAGRFAVNFTRCNYREFRHAYAYGEEMLKRMDKDAWFFTGGDNAFFVGTYMKYCAGRRLDVALMTPSEWYFKALHEATDNGMSRATVPMMVELLSRDEGKFLNPVFNHELQFKPSATPIYVAFVPDFMQKSVRPDGIVFKVAERTGEEEERQLAYWESLLKEPMFRLDVGSKADFRLNMVEVLKEHAAWHQHFEEFKIATFLYNQSVSYSIKARPDIHPSLAYCSYRVGDMAAAHKYAMAAVDYNSADTYALTTLARVYVARGNFKGASNCFERIVSLRPEDGEARATLDKLQAGAEKAERNN